jgi:hypothetical protein
MQPTQPTPAIYLRTAALNQILNAKLGDTARDEDKAAFLGINRVTLWRIRDQQARVGNDLIVRALRAIPDAGFDDLFEIRDNPPPRDKVPAPRRRRRSDLQDVAA